MYNNIMQHYYFSYSMLHVVEIMSACTYLKTHSFCGSSSTEYEINKEYKPVCELQLFEFI